MTAKQKQKVRDILFDLVSDEAMIKYTGKPHIRHNRIASESGNASTYALDLFNYKIDKICDEVNNHKDIMDILDYKPKGSELAKNSGASAANISQMKKRSKNGDSYGYNYHVKSFQIERIAELVGA